MSLANANKCSDLKLQGVVFSAAKNLRRLMFFQNDQAEKTLQYSLKLALRAPRALQIG